MPEKVINGTVKSLQTASMRMGLDVGAITSLVDGSIYENMIEIRSLETHIALSHLPCFKKRE